MGARVRVGEGGEGAGATAVLGKAGGGVAVREGVHYLKCQGAYAACGHLNIVPCDRYQNGSDLNLPATVTGFFTVC